MSYDTPEASVADGRPYFLYQFASSSGTTTRLTSHAEDLVRSSQTWTASHVSHRDIEQNGTVERQNLDIEFALSDAFAQGFLETRSDTVTVTVYRGHFTDLTDELRAVWKGRVVGARAEGLRIVLAVESVFTSLRNPGCRARFTRLCRHALYSDACGVNIAYFQVAGTVSAVSGNGLVLTVAAAASADANDYRGGIVTWNGVNGFVRRHSGSTLTLLTAIPGLEEYVTAYGSASVTLAPGCNLSRARCNDRFNNVLNFGGFPYMTTLNPFVSSIG